MSARYSIPATLPKKIFRAYDIRGEVSEDGITEDVAYAIGMGLGSEAFKHDQSEIVVGRDGRLNSPVLVEALIQGLCDSGQNVIDIGVVPSPLLYFATHRLSTHSGVMLTGSHNPKHHNGFKILIKRNNLTSDEIQYLYQRIVEQHFSRGNGKVRSVDVVEDYLRYVSSHFSFKKPLKIVVDCGNGAAGVLAVELFQRLGCEVDALFCEVDGNFPNHHPDPSVPENLNALIDRVKKTKADCGIAFDGDADRLGLVTDRGDIIWPDRQLMLFAKDLLSRHPNEKIVFDVKCSKHLASVIRENGGVPVMWKTGHSLLKAKMIEENALLAGEMSGHHFFKEAWFGFDDGMFAAVRFLKILSESDLSAGELFAQFPNSVNTPELKIAISDSEKHAFIETLIEKAQFENAERITIDGLRVEFEKGWGLVRASNTTPYLIARFEADTKDDLTWVQDQFRTVLLELKPDLELPF